MFATRSLPEELPARCDAAGHHLFGLRAATPRAGAIAGALAQRARLHHAVPDLDMDEREWARLFAGSHG